MQTEGVSWGVIAWHVADATIRNTDIFLNLASGPITESFRRIFLHKQYYCK